MILVSSDFTPVTLGDALKLSTASTKGENLSRDYVKDLQKKYILLYLAIILVTTLIYMEQVNAFKST